MHRNIRCTWVLEEENRKKKIEAKNMLKYLIISFKAEILFCFDISHNTGDSAGDYGTLSYLSTTKYSNDRTISTVSFIVMGAL